MPEAHSSLQFYAESPGKRCLDHALVIGQDPDDSSGRYWSIQSPTFSCNAPEKPPSAPPLDALPNVADDP
jgi:hypothetical protein